MAQAQARIRIVQQETESLRYEADRLNRKDEALEARRDATEQDIGRRREGGLHSLDVGVESPIPIRPSLRTEGER